MGRPPIGEKAMTAAERVRRYRLKHVTKRNETKSLAPVIEPSIVTAHQILKALAELTPRHFPRGPQAIATVEAFARQLTEEAARLSPHETDTQHAANTPTKNKPTDAASGYSGIADAIHRMTDLPEADKRIMLSRIVMAWGIDTPASWQPKEADEIISDFFGEKEEDLPGIAREIIERFGRDWAEAIWWELEEQIEKLDDAKCEAEYVAEEAAAKTKAAKKTMSPEAKERAKAKAKATRELSAKIAAAHQRELEFEKTTGRKLKKVEAIAADQRGEANTRSIAESKAEELRHAKPPPNPYRPPPLPSSTEMWDRARKRKRK